MKTSRTRYCLPHWLLGNHLWKSYLFEQNSAYEFSNAVSLNFDEIILLLLHTFQQLGLELKLRQRHLPLQAINTRWCRGVSRFASFVVIDTNQFHFPSSSLLYKRYEKALRDTLRLLMCFLIIILYSAVQHHNSFLNWRNIFCTSLTIKKWAPRYVWERYSAFRFGLCSIESFSK